MKRPGPTLEGYDVAEDWRCNACGLEAPLPRQGRCIGAVREELAKRTEARMAAFYQRHPALEPNASFAAWAYMFQIVEREQGDAIDLPHAWALRSESFTPRCVIGGDR